MNGQDAPGMAMGISLYKGSVASYLQTLDAAAQALVDRTRHALRRIEPAELDGRAGADVVFKIRDTGRLFSAEGFLMSFSLPNFHFHATTAYNILRSRGVPLGKLDDMGALRLKSPETP